MYCRDNAPVDAGDVRRASMSTGLRAAVAVQHGVDGLQSAGDRRQHGGPLQQGRHGHAAGLVEGPRLGLTGGH